MRLSTPRAADDRPNEAQSGSNRRFASRRRPQSTRATAYARQPCRPGSWAREQGNSVINAITILIAFPRTNAREQLVITRCRTGSASRRRKRFAQPRARGPQRSPTTSGAPTSVPSAAGPQPSTPPQQRNTASTCANAASASIGCGYSTRRPRPPPPGRTRPTSSSDAPPRTLLVRSSTASPFASPARRRQRHAGAAPGTAYPGRMVVGHARALRLSRARTVGGAHGQRALLERRRLVRAIGATPRTPAAAPGPGGSRTCSSRARRARAARSSRAGQALRKRLNPRIVASSSA